MNWLCKILGHRWLPRINPIGEVMVDDFAVHEIKMECSRCKCWFKCSHIN